MATISGVESLRALENSSKAKSNLAVAQLMESALQRGEGCLASDGALVAVTGERTGRSPKDKFIVDDPVTHDLVHWGKINQAITPERFEALLEGGGHPLLAVPSITSPMVEEPLAIVLK